MSHILLECGQSGYHPIAVSRRLRKRLKEGVLADGETVAVIVGELPILHF